MTAQLTVNEGGHERVCDLGETFTIGRGAENDLALGSDAAVSRRHARIQRSPEGWLIDDLGSQNGTFVQREGASLRVAQDFLLADGDVIWAGAARITYSVDDSGPPGAGIEETVVLAPERTVIGRVLPKFVRQREGGGDPGGDDRGPQRRVEAVGSWQLSIPPAAAAQRVRAFITSEGMKPVSDDGLEIAAEGGSQMTARLAGGWMGSAKNFPKRAMLRVREGRDGTIVEAEIFETLATRDLDGNVRKRYEEDFARWIDALKAALHE